MISSRRQTLLGIRIGSGSLMEIIDRAFDASRAATAPFKFACANPHSLVVSQFDQEFSAALKSSDALVADGVGVSLAGALAGVPVGPRITGTDFFIAAMSRLNQSGGRAFFFGSSVSVLKRICVQCALDFPKVQVFTLSPPFGAWSMQDNEAMLRTIIDARPDVLWVGMTAPRQEKWVQANVHRLNVKVIGSIGAVFDFYAGVKKRAPQWICNIGLEWLYRLSREPMRLWQRTLISAPQFLWLVLRDRLRSSARHG